MAVKYRRQVRRVNTPKHSTPDHKVQSKSIAGFMAGDGQFNVLYERTSGK